MFILMPSRFVKMVQEKERLLPVKGYVQTVKGLISAEALGKTMTHEHFLWDQRCWWKGEPEELSKRDFIYKKVGIEILGELHYKAHQNLDNIVQFDVDTAIKEAKYFKREGGCTIADVSSIGLGRDPRALLAISEMTGINVIMGAGYYIAASHPAYIKDMDEGHVTELIIKEFEYGVKDTGIKPGVIGEIGVSDINNPEEVKVLKAAAIAQKATDAAVFVHPPIFETHAHAILDIIEKQGGNIEKVVMCHCDPTLDKPEYHDSIAKRGAYIEYDQFGLEIMGVEGLFLPRDIERVRAVAKQIEMGNMHKILLSQDVCFKTCLIRYGGWGYGHVLRNIVPMLKSVGITEEEMNTMLVDNPKKVMII